MAYSYTQYTVASSNDTTTTYATPPYRSGKAATDISVAVDGVTKTVTTDYTISGTSVTFTVAGAPLANSVVRIARNTSQNAAPSDYSENTILTSAQLNATQEQLFFMAQEAIDTASETNLAGLTFYSSSTSAPTSPSLGDLWYDTFNKYLKIYNGNEWELATPTNESFTYTSFTGESGTYSYVTIANLNTEALVFLNGVKQVRDTVKANLLASSGAKDYFIDTENKRLYFKTLGADSVVEVVLAAATLGTAKSTKIDTFTATAGQTVFNLSNSYLQNTNSVNIFVNGVRQSAFTETDNNTVTLTNGASVGDEVVVIINLYDTVQGSIDSVNVTHTPAGTGAVATTLKAKLDVTVSVKDFGAKGDGVTDDTSAFNAAFASIESGTIVIPYGTYKVGDITISEKNNTTSNIIGYLNVEGNGANLIPASSNNKFILAACKHVNVSDLDFIQHTLCFRGVWFTSITNCKFPVVKMGDVTHSGSWMTHVWNTFNNCFLQTVIVDALAGFSNANTFNDCKFRGDSGQGFSGNAIYALEFNSNTSNSLGGANCQNWVIRGGDISGDAGYTKVYNIGASNTTNDIDLTFDGVYFDFETPEAPTRDKAHVRVLNSQASNIPPYSVPFSDALKNPTDLWRSDRSVKHAATTSLNLLNNGDLRVGTTSWSGSGRLFSNLNSATLTEQSGGISGRYLNINQTNAGSNAVYMQATLPEASVATAVLIAKSATGATQTVRVGAFGLYYDYVLSPSEWTVFTSSDSTMEAAGTVTVTIGGDSNAAFNIDLAYASVAAGEGSSLILPATPQDKNYHLANINIASIANGATHTETVTVSGAAQGDFVQASFGGDILGLEVTAYVSATNTVKLLLRNNTGGSVDLSAGNWRFLVTKKIY
tara:strand:- start:8661 stop:11303 length:2643 start_codon:yes stop_codon:yes gene_type:complete